MRHLAKTKNEMNSASLGSYLAYTSKVKEHHLKRYIMSLKATCGE